MVQWADDYLREQQQQSTNQPQPQVEPGNGRSFDEHLGLEGAKWNGIIYRDPEGKLRQSSAYDTEEEFMQHQLPNTGKIEERGYWENPQRVARYNDFLRSAPPDWTPPDWLNPEQIKAAYSYMKQKNQDKPWQEWGWLKNEDPATQWLRSVNPPPPEYLMPDEQQFIKTPEQVNQAKPIDYNSLAPWQKGWLSLTAAPAMTMGYDASGNQVEMITGRTPLSKIMATLVTAVPGALGGAAMGGTIGAIAGGVGALPGAIIGGAIGGIGSAYTGWTGQQIPVFSQLMAITNVLAVGLERSVGTAWQFGDAVSQQSKDPDTQALSEFLTDLPAVWYASANTWANIPGNPGNAFLWGAKQIENATGADLGAAKSQYADEDEVWKIAQGFTTAQATGYDETGIAALRQIREEIDDRTAAGENPGIVAAEILTKFGDDGTVKQQILQTILDPANLFPSVSAGAVKNWATSQSKLAFKAGKSADGLAYSRLAKVMGEGQGNIATDMLPPIIQNIFEGTMRAVTKGTYWEGSKGALGQFALWKQQVKAGVWMPEVIGMPDDMRAKYKELDAQGIKPDKIKVKDNVMTWKDSAGRDQTFTASRAIQYGIPEVDELTDWEHKLAGIDNKYGIEEFRPTTGNNWIKNLTKLTPASQTHMMLEAFHANMATLLSMANGDVTTMQKLFRQAAGTEKVKAGDLGEAILKSPTMRGLQNAIGYAITKDGTLNNLMATWANGTKARDILNKIAAITGLKQSEIVEMAKMQPDKLALLLEQTALKLPDELGTQGKRDAVTKLLKPFTDKDPTPWNEQLMQTTLVVTIADKMDGWYQDVMGLKADHAVFRLSNMMKGVQSLLLLGLNPAYFINNTLNNMVTRSAVGVMGFMTATQIDDFMTRFGIVPSRMSEGVGAEGLGDTYGGNKIIKGTEPNDWIAKSTKAIRKTSGALGIFSRLSQAVEQNESKQAYAIAMSRFWGKNWKRNIGFSGMHPVLESMLDQKAPGMKEWLYQAAEAGMNMNEIRDAIMGESIKPVINGIMNEVIDTLTPHSAEPIKQLFHETGLIKQLEHELGAARTQQDIDNAFDKLDSKLREFITGELYKDIQAAVEKGEQLVSKERLPAILQLHGDLEIRRGEHWINARRQWEDLYSKREALAATGEWNQAVKKLQKSQREDWDRINKLELTTMKGAVRALGIGDTNALAYINDMNAANQNWQDFYHTADKYYADYFRTISAFSGETWEVRSVRRQAAWDDLQEKLNKLYDKHFKLEAKIQGRMDKTFATMYQATGWDKAKAQDWRKQVWNIRQELYNMQKQARLDTKDMDVNARDDYYAEMNPKYNALIAAIKELEHRGAYELFNETAPSRTINVPEGRKPVPSEPDWSGEPNPTTRATDYMEQARKAGLVNKDGNPVAIALKNVINAYLKEQGQPEITLLDHATPEQVTAALARHKAKNANKKAAEQIVGKIQYNDIVRQADTITREAEIHAAALNTRKDIEQAYRDTMPNATETEVKLQMMLTDLVADRYAKSQKIIPTDSSRDAWYATRMSRYERKTGTGDTGKGLPGWAIAQEDLTNSVKDWYYSRALKYVEENTIKTYPIEQIWGEIDRPVKHGGKEMDADGNPIPKGTPKVDADGNPITVKEYTGLLASAGVKLDEIKWLGLLPWLEEQKALGKTSVSKADLAQFIRDNQVRVVERVLGEPDQRTIEELADQIREDKVSEYIDNHPEVYDDYPVPTIDAMPEEILGYKYEVDVRNDTYRFTTLEEAENFQVKVMDEWEAEIRAEIYNDRINDVTEYERQALNNIEKPSFYGYMDQRGTNYKEILVMLPDVKPVTTGNHWNKENVIVSILVDERIERGTGKKVYHIQEIQSDWNERGRKYGYIDTAKPYMTKPEIQQFQEAMQEVRLEGIEIARRADFEELPSRKDYDAIYEGIIDKYGSDWVGKLSPEDQAKYDEVKRRYDTEFQTISMIASAYSAMHAQYVNAKIDAYDITQGIKIELKKPTELKLEVRNLENKGISQRLTAKYNDEDIEYLDTSVRVEQDPFSIAEWRVTGNFFNEVRGNFREEMSALKAANDLLMAVPFYEATLEDGSVIRSYSFSRIMNQAGFSRLSNHNSNPSSRFPKNPFMETNKWVMLGMKYAIQDAAKKGFDKVSWSRPDTLVNRYEGQMRQTVDRLEWEPDGAKPRVNDFTHSVKDQSYITIGENNGYYQIIVKDPGRAYFEFDPTTGDDLRFTTREAAVAWAIDEGWSSPGVRIDFTARNDEGDDFYYRIEPTIHEPPRYTVVEYDDADIVVGYLPGFSGEVSGSRPYQRSAINALQEYLNNQSHLEKIIQREYIELENLALDNAPIGEGSGTLIGHKDGNEVLREHVRYDSDDANDETLVRYVGGEVAKRLAAEGSVTGDKLTVGGQIYELIYKKIMQEQDLPKYIKQWGSEIEKIDIRGGRGTYEAVPDEGSFDSMYGYKIEQQAPDKYIVLATDGGDFIYRDSAVSFRTREGAIDHIYEMQTNLEKRYMAQSSEEADGSKTYYIHDEFLNEDVYTVGKQADGTTKWNDVYEAQKLVRSNESTVPEEQTVFPYGAPDEDELQPVTRYRVVSDEDAPEPNTPFMTEQQARDWAEASIKNYNDDLESGYTPLRFEDVYRIEEFEEVPDDSMPGFEITPAMKDTVTTRGQALQQSRKGEISYEADGRAIITAFDAADATTMIHELGHLFRRDLEIKDLEIVARMGGLRDAAELNDLQSRFFNGELTDGDDDWVRYTQCEEYFARAWERYLIEGDIPEITHVDFTTGQKTRLKTVLKQFTDWVLNIYKSLKGENGKVTGFADQEGFTKAGRTVDLKAKIGNTSLKDIFDNMLEWDPQRNKTLEGLVSDKYKEDRDRAGGQRSSRDESNRIATKNAVKEILGEYRDEAEAIKAAESMDTPRKNDAGSNIDEAVIYEALQLIKDKPEFNPWVNKEVKIIKGTETTADGITDVNQKYKLQWLVLDLEDLIASDKIRGNKVIPNADYNQKKQGRDRGAPASVAQIIENAKNLNADILMKDTQAIEKGSPIIDSSRMVLSGNGRTLFITKAIQDYPERWAEYRQQLDVYAPKYGIDPAEYQDMKNPVLVRMLDETDLTPEQVIEFTRDANTPVAAAMSAEEIAMDVGKKLNPESLLDLKYEEDDTVKGFIDRNPGLIETFRREMPDNQRATYFDANGMKKAGYDQLSMIIFSTVYEGEAAYHLLNLFGSSDAPNTKTIEKALYMSLPILAKIEIEARAGRINPDLSIARDIARAADLVVYYRNSAKDRFKDLQQYLDAERSAMIDPVTAEQATLALEFDKATRSPKQIVGIISKYAEKASREPNNLQPDIFNPTAKARGKGEILNEIFTEQAAEQSAADQSILTNAAETPEMERPGSGEGTGAVSEELNRVGEGEGSETPEARQARVVRQEQIKTKWEAGQFIPLEEAEGMDLHHNTQAIPPPDVAELLAGKGYKGNKKQAVIEYANWIANGEKGDEPNINPGMLDRMKEEFYLEGYTALLRDWASSKLIAAAGDIPAKGTFAIKTPIYKHGDHTIIGAIYQDGKLVGFLPDSESHAAKQIVNGKEIRVIGVDPNYPDKWIYLEDGKVQSHDTKAGLPQEDYRETWVTYYVANIISNPKSNGVHSPTDMIEHMVMLLRRADSLEDQDLIMVEVKRQLSTEQFSQIFNTAKNKNIFKHQDKRLHSDDWTPDINPTLTQEDQPDMFGYTKPKRGEYDDLPLFSGKPMEADQDKFKPGAAQTSFFDQAPIVKPPDRIVEFKIKTDAGTEYLRLDIKKLAAIREKIEGTQEQIPYRVLDKNNRVIKSGKDITDVTEPKLLTQSLGQEYPEITGEGEYWEYVRTADLKGSEEFNRRTDYKYEEDYYEQLKEKIAQNGITEPLVGDYSQVNGLFYIGEGNHRLAAAQDLGIEYVPLRVVATRMSANPKGIKTPTPQQPMNKGGHLSGTPLPHELGFETFKRENIIAIKKPSLGQEDQPKGRYKGEYLESASFTVNGRTYTAKSHYEAKKKAKAAGILFDKRFMDDGIPETSQVYTGFITTLGREIGRNEAWDHFGTPVSEQITAANKILKQTDETGVGQYKATLGLDKPTLAQEADINTPAFSNWFGDSKVVDEHGKPQVVYRGQWGEPTENPFDSTVRNTPTFVDNPEIANLYANEPNDPELANGKIIRPDLQEVYLKIEKPFMLSDEDDPMTELRHLLPLKETMGEEAFWQEIDRIGRKRGGWHYDGDILKDQSINSIRKHKDMESIYLDSYMIGDDAVIVNAAKTAGFDGFIYYADSAGEMGKEYRPFSAEQIKSINNQGTWDPNNRNVLMQEDLQPGEPQMTASDNPLPEWLRAERQQPDQGAIADGNPIGEVPLNGTPQPTPAGEPLQELYRDIQPIMSRMKDTYSARSKERPFKMGDLDPASKKEVEKWLAQINNDMGSMKMATINHGSTLRDAALLNYTKRYGFDNFLGLASPYQFWYTRSMVNWARRMVDKPGWFAMYARIQAAQERNEKNMPSRLKGRQRINMPWLPDWAGGGMFIDPMKTLFPPDSFAQPFETMTMNQNQINKRAEQILMDMGATDQFTPDEVRKAIQTKSGKAWTLAIRQAEQELDKSGNPINLASMMLQPPLWWNALSNIASGTPEKISTLPITRTGQSLRALGKGTMIEPVTNVAGMLMAGGEEAIRKGAGLSEFGEWGDWLIDREISNMVGDGEIGYEEGNIAMIDRQGEIFQEARSRVEYQRALGQTGMAGAFAIKEGASLPQIVGAFLTSMFPGGLFPEGELKQRGLAEEYKNAWNKYNAGHEEAINEFFDMHPEYKARLALFAEPEERMRQFLVGQVWEKYMSLEKPNRSKAADELGEEFRMRFLDQTTANTDEIDVALLADWAQALGSKIPQTEETQGIPARELDLYPPELVKAISEYKESRDQLFPNYYAVQQNYYALPAGTQRKAYLQQNPMLKNYWEWNKNWKDTHPELKPYLEEQTAKYEMEASMNEMTEPLIRQIFDYSMGRQLTTGATAELTRIWKMTGSKIPFDEFVRQLAGALYK